MVYSVSYFVCTRLHGVHQSAANLHINADISFSTRIPIKKFIWCLSYFDALYSCIFIVVYLEVSARYSMLKKLHVHTVICSQLTSQRPHFSACG